MMSDGEVIKSFLVGLGFGVDESSLAKFNKAIASASLRVVALYGTIKVAAAGIFWGISKISEGFEQMGYEYRIIAPAINKALVLRRELLRAYSAAGINIVKVVQQSVKFNLSLAKTQFALKAIYTSVGAKFFPLLTKQMDIFRGKIYANMPKIQASLEKFVFFVFKAFEATVALGTRVWSILTRVYDFFVMLDKATDGWSTVILGVVAAWKFLNLAFINTPLGRIIAGLTFILALWDDFKTFKEGGESLIDWGKRSNQILGVLSGIIAAMPALIFGVTKAFSAWTSAKSIFMDIKKGLDIINILTGITAIELGLWLIILGLVGAAVYLIWRDWDQLTAKVQKFIDSLKQIPSAIGKMFDFGSSAWNIPGYKPGGQENYLGANPNVSNTKQNNINVNNQTDISVNGTADANQTAKATAGIFDKMNFSLFGNLMNNTQ